MKTNKFGANIVNNYDYYEKLSKEYNIPLSEIIQIDLNRCGIFLPNNEVIEDYRVRVKGHILDDYETWYALPVRAEEDTNFKAVDGKIYFQDIIIGELTSQLMLDTCENSYQRGPNLLNLNSRSRSNCGGCKACVHNYKKLYDNTVIKDKEGLYTAEAIEDFFDKKNIDVSMLTQIAVVTGLFNGEEKVLEHMKLISEVAKKRDFKGELMYFGCEANSEDALTELSKLDSFALIYALDNFSKRNELLTKSKSLITIDDAKSILDNAKSKGIKTTISYIAGLDSLEELKNGFTLLKDSITQFPIINIYQIQTKEQVQIMDYSASNIEYYLESRLILEEILLNKNFMPKRWSNYRPLWYNFYKNEKMEDNSFGQLEKVKKI